MLARRLTLGSDEGPADRVTSGPVPAFDYINKVLTTLS